MFNFLKTADVVHPDLGTLKWQRGCWRGELALHDGVRVPLILGGSRKAPDEGAIAHAVGVPRALDEIRPQLERALFEHYEPYAEAVSEGHLTPKSGRFAEIASPAQAFAQAQPEAVAIVLLDGEIAAEVCYNVPWDEEHIVGARFRGSQWIELCGSTLIP